MNDGWMMSWKNDGWVKHLETSLSFNGSLPRLFTELACTVVPVGAKRGALAPQNLRANTHIGSLGALGSFGPLVTWVALKCKNERPWLEAPAVQCEGKAGTMPRCLLHPWRAAPRGWGCGRPPPRAGRGWGHRALQLRTQCPCIGLSFPELGAQVGAPLSCQGAKAALALAGQSSPTLGPWGPLGGRWPTLPRLPWEQQIKDSRAIQAC